MWPKLLISLLLTSTTPLCRCTYHKIKNRGGTGETVSFVNHLEIGV